MPGGLLRLGRARCDAAGGPEERAGRDLLVLRAGGPRLRRAGAPACKSRRAAGLRLARSKLRALEGRTVEGIGLE